MKTVNILTQMGKVTVEIKVTADPAYNTLGVTNEKMEIAFASVITEKIKSIGGKWAPDNVPLPPEWQN